jgi:hypothetical protein
VLEELSLPFRLLFVSTVFLLSLCSTVVAETNLEVKKLVSFLDLSPFPVSVLVICCFLLLLLQMSSLSGPSFVILRKSSRQVSQSSSVQDFVVSFFLAKWMLFDRL